MDLLAAKSDYIVGACVDVLNEAAVKIHNVEGKDATLIVSCAQLSKVILTKSMDSTFRVESYYESFSNSHVDDVF